MSPDAENVAARMAEAASNFLDSLNPEQRPPAHWPFPSTEERLRWYYTPTDHGGLPLSSMRASQQQLAFKLLAAGLSRPAYVTACMIVGLDNVLDELEGWTMRWERDRGRDPGLYYVRVFGNPGGRQAWSWRFGGHHISVHHLVVDFGVVSVGVLDLQALDQGVADRGVGDHPDSNLARPHIRRTLLIAIGRQLTAGLGVLTRHPLRAVASL